MVFFKGQRGFFSAVFLWLGKLSDEVPHGLMM